MGDDEQRDWIHKEVHCALQSQCNIIPVFDNFAMPDPAELPGKFFMNFVIFFILLHKFHKFQKQCVELPVTMESNGYMIIKKLVLIKSIVSYVVI